MEVAELDHVRMEVREVVGVTLGLCEEEEDTRGVFEEYGE